jgi:osmoprotectant transport system permease protein
VSVLAPLGGTPSPGPVIPSFGGGGSGSCVAKNGQFCGAWFVDNFGSRFAPRLAEHVELTAIAIGIGFAVAMAAALFAHRHGWFETPFSLFAAFLYTIPALAFFELMVQVTGINRFTAEIALVSYTLLILFVNTLAGLRAVPPDALEAAQAMGLSRRQVLLRVELPLALPPIMAGVRIATVTTISLTTVAAYIGAGGLGEPIFDGIQTGFRTEFIAAGGLAIVLALAADGLLVVAQRLLTPWARRGRA